MSGVTLAGGQPSGGNTDVGDGGGRALKLQTDTPHLVSMGGDRLSTSVTLHPLPPGPAKHRFERKHGAFSLKYTY
ncbi:hypothetical protein YQE_02574, partial [Dendroctonus ponderosae]